MWRMSGDFWDDWGSLDHAFDLRARWQGEAGPGHWPDSDMIPLGHIGIRSVGGPRNTRFTHDEQITMMSLWAMGPSPLMLGMNLPDNDAWTNSLLTNDAVLAIDQDKLGSPAIRASKEKGAEIWVKELSGGDKAVGLFNRDQSEQKITLKWDDAKLKGKQQVKDLWAGKDLGIMDGSLTLVVPSHGAILLRLTPGDR
jgi:hypothetical protein